MKISLAQINPTVGDIEGNAEKIISIIKSSKSDISVFPELSVTGYSPGDLVLRKSFVLKSITALKKIAKNTKNKSAVVGFIGKDKQGNIYNSAAFISNKKIVKVHNKICLPSYSIFDEKRWFKEGKQHTIINFNKTNIGLNICEDIWRPEVAMEQKRKGAELLINISASPYSSEKIEAIEKTLIQRNLETNLPILYCNQVGAQDGIVYYGHSMFVKDGKIIKKAKDFVEDILKVEIMKNAK